MEIFGIGPLEFIVILLIAFIVLGPQDIAKTGRSLGRLLRKVITSQWWSGFRHASREISQLPYTLMREASIEDASKSLYEIKTIGDDLAKSNDPLVSPNFDGWINPPIFAEPSPQKTISPKNDPQKGATKDTETS